MKYLILLLILSGCAHKETVCENYLEYRGQSSRLLAFGDSQTAGHASETGLGCGFSYANALSLHYQKQLVMLAIGGTEFLSREEYGALLKTDYRKSDDVVMMIGFNDMRAYGMNTDHLFYFQQSVYNTIMVTARKVHSITIATTLDPINYGAHGSRQAVLAYRSAVHAAVAMAGMENVIAFDPPSRLDHNPYFFVEDNTHINMAGQLIMFDAFVEEMK